MCNFCYKCFKCGFVCMPKSSLLFDDRLVCCYRLCCLVQIPESQLSSLRSLGLQFEVTSLVKQCEESMERFKLNKKLFDSGKCVELSYPCSRPQCWTAFPFGVPIDVLRLRQLHSTNKYSDVNIYIEGHGLIAQSHKVILSLWSLPFAKVSICTFLFGS